jgi:hypothetical protein
MGMNYELAKKLKDAGFPQSGRGGFKWTDEEPHLGEPVYIPTLSELIEACGEEFGTLGKYKWPSGDGRADWLATQQYDAENLGKNNKGEGSTPEKAVANLWLALNSKPV